MKTFQTSFSGQMLERGFWLYIWRNRHKKKNEEVWYIGRTGDNSSSNAASPIGRLSQYLNLKENTKGNSLIKNLAKVSLKPEDCQFKLVAVGPMFPEQVFFTDHKSYRDIMACLEAEIAYHFKSSGHQVLGNHPKRGRYNTVLFKEALSQINDAFKK